MAIFDHKKIQKIVQRSVLDCNHECEKYRLFYPSLINYFQSIRCCHMWEDSAIYVLLCLVVLGATFIDGIVYIVQAAINPERVHCLFEFCNIVTCNWIYDDDIPHSVSNKKTLKGNYKPVLFFFYLVILKHFNSVLLAVLPENQSTKSTKRIIAVKKCAAYIIILLNTMHCKISNHM